MMATVKDLVSSVASSDFVKRFGGDAAELAKNVGYNVSDFAKNAGGSAAGLAKAAGGSAVVLAKKVGTRRALIGLAAIGAVIGGVALVRYLRANREDAEDIQGADSPASQRRARKQTRAKRKAAHAAMQH